MNTDQDNLLETANAYQSRLQFDEAASIYKCILDNNPNQPDALYNFSQLELLRNNNHEAIRYAIKASREYANKGLYLDAISTLKSISEISPNKKFIYDELLSLYQYVDDSTAASNLHQAYSDWLISHGSYDLAITQLKAAEALNPTNPVIGNRLAELLDSEGQYNQAANLYIQSAKEYTLQRNYVGALLPLERFSVIEETPYIKSIKPKIMFIRKELTLFKHRSSGAIYQSTTKPLKPSNNNATEKQPLTAKEAQIYVQKKREYDKTTSNTKPIGKDNFHSSILNKWADFELWQHNPHNSLSLLSNSDTFDGDAIIIATKAINMIIARETININPNCIRLFESKILSLGYHGELINQIRIATSKLSKIQNNQHTSNITLPYNSSNKTAVSEINTTALTFSTPDNAPSAFIHNLIWSPVGTNLAYGTTTGIAGLHYGQNINIHITTTHFPAQAVFANSDNNLIVIKNDAIAVCSTLNDTAHFKLPLTYPDILLPIYLHKSDCLLFLSRGKLTRIFNITSKADLRVEPSSNSNRIISYCLNHDFNLVATLGEHGDICLSEFSSNKYNVTTFGVHYGAKILSINKTATLIASASENRTICLWRCNRNIPGNPTSPISVFEGHTQTPHSIAFSNDGRLLFSLDNNSLKIWSIDRLTCLATIQKHPEHPIISTMSVNPKENKIALGTGLNTYIIDIDVERLLSTSEIPIVKYTSAKIVLLGKSDVGKSCLAMRLAENRYPSDNEQQTTHGMKCWTVPPARFITQSFPEDERRDITLWDFGGQEEYRLIHQLFLHDTTMALVLFDPTRDDFSDVEIWSNRLEKHFQGRPTRKILVGTKVDGAISHINRSDIEHIRDKYGFTDYIETSAKNNLGIQNLINAISNKLDWATLTTTSRPEFFQQIRDKLEEYKHRTIISLDDFLLEMFGPQFSNEQREATNAVITQLAQQGLLALCRSASESEWLILQVHEIERYGASLILAAKNNPRGVPALELKALGSLDLKLPRILPENRLPRAKEKIIIECTVQLLLTNGICFSHEGLLVFPSLFPLSESSTQEVPDSLATMYYDFSGAIDNIYASLVAWLVIAQDFGELRLWANRAEFSIEGHGVCGIYKTKRSGGFANLNIYFDTFVQQDRRDTFINFTENHLKQQGINIKEHLRIKCDCGATIPEDRLRIRISKGYTNIHCDECANIIAISDGFTSKPHNNINTNQTIEDQSWALKTKIIHRKELITADAVTEMSHYTNQTLVANNIRILHLSDLHFNDNTYIEPRVLALQNDIKYGAHLGHNDINFLVISGDFTHKGNSNGFTKAKEFIKQLRESFSLSAERCIFVPGNHDIQDIANSYILAFEHDVKHLPPDDWIMQGSSYCVKNGPIYPLRLKQFSDDLYHPFLTRPYPLEASDQGQVFSFWDERIQFIALNSCWKIDHYHRDSSAIHEGAVLHAINEAKLAESTAITNGELIKGSKILRIGVWHHAPYGEKSIKSTGFIGHLQHLGVNLILHGDVHEANYHAVGMKHNKAKIHAVSAGSFNADGNERPDSVPRLYNLICIDRELSKATVHTRFQRKSDDPWEPWYDWSAPGDNNTRLPFYNLPLA